MKRLCMIIAALALVVGVNAQENKMWVGGSLNFTASGSANVSVVPTFGYFFADNLSIEGTLDLGFGSHTSHYGVTAVGRYWLPIENSALYYTPGLSLGFDIDRYSDIKQTYTDFGMGLQLGAFHYKVSPQWSVSANLCEFKFSDIGGGNYTRFAISTSTTFSVNYFF